MKDKFDYERNVNEKKILFPKLKLLPISTSILCIIFITISFFYEVEVMIISEGKIIPESDVMYVNSVVNGRILEVYVENGQYIEKGSKILRYDLSKERSKLEDYKSEKDILILQINEIDRIVNKLFLKGINQSYSEIGISDENKAEYVSKAKRLVNVAISKVKAYEYEYDQNKLKTLIYESKVERVETELDRYSEIITMDSNLVGKGLINRREFKERVHRYELLVIELDSANQELHLSNQQLKNYNQRIEIVKSELFAQLEEISFDISRKVKSLRRDILWSNNVLRNEVLLSRISGYVTDISANIDGNFVSNGEILLKIVPKDSKFTVKSYVSNSDIGFVIPGQNVRVRVEAFNYNRYGYINGKVLYISKDSKYLDGGMFYELKIELNNEDSKFYSRDIKLMSGLSVKADIITGRRTVASYFLYPIYHGLNYSLIER